jgi:hypothetical protein
VRRLWLITPHHSTQQPTTSHNQPANLFDTANQQLTTTSTTTMTTSMTMTTMMTEKKEDWKGKGLFVMLPLKSHHKPPATGPQ